MVYDFSFSLFLSLICEYTQNWCIKFVQGWKNWAVINIMSKHWENYTVGSCCLCWPQNLLFDLKIVSFVLKWQTTPSPPFVHPSNGRLYSPLSTYVPCTWGYNGHFTLVSSSSFNLCHYHHLHLQTITTDIMFFHSIRPPPPSFSKPPSRAKPTTIFTLRSSPTMLFKHLFSPYLKNRDMKKPSNQAPYLDDHY